MCVTSVVDLMFDHWQGDKKVGSGLQRYDFIRFDGSRNSNPTDKKCRLPLWFICVTRAVSLLCIVCETYGWHFAAPCVCPSDLRTVNNVSDISRYVLCTSTHTDLVIVWSGLLLYDFVIFLLTLVGTLRMRKGGSRSITDILLRDGVSIDLAPFRRDLAL